MNLPEYKQDDFDYYVNVAQQQMNAPQHVIMEEPEMSFVELLLDTIPVWFQVSAFIVGAITLGLIMVKFSPVWSYLKTLIKMWKSI